MKTLTNNKSNKKRILTILESLGEMKQSDILNYFLAYAVFTEEQKLERADFKYKMEIKKALLELKKDGMIQSRTMDVTYWKINN